MNRWIAYERDDTGWPTDAFLVVAAETRDDARAAMADAITARRASDDDPLPLLARISEIFIEAPTQLDARDPRAELPGGAHGPVFHGFDRPAPPRPRPATPYRS